MDDGFLIEQVALFPALYNKNDSRFKNKTAKEQAWTTIAELIGCSAEECMQRWTVLRAKYTNLRKQIRDTPSGSGGYTISWPYYEAMGFLDAFLIQRKTISNIRCISPQVSPIEEVQDSSIFWDSTSQIESDVSFDIPDIDPETDSSPHGIPAKRAKFVDKTSPTTANFRTKLATLKKPSTHNNKKSAQETMFQSISTAIDELHKRKRADDVYENRANFSWAKSLSEDMNILSPQEQIIFKQKCYTVLSEMVEKNMALKFVNNFIL